MTWEPLLDIRSNESRTDDLDFFTQKLDNLMGLISDLTGEFGDETHTLTEIVSMIARDVQIEAKCIIDSSVLIFTSI